MTEELRAELAALVAAVRQHLEVEASLGSSGLVAPVPSRAEAAAPAARAAEPVRSAEEPARAEAAGREPVTATAGEREAEPPRAETPRSEAEPAAAAGDKVVRLAALAEQAAACRACVLHERRTQSVFARGNPNAELAFVGEGPGQEEDLQGYPFVGPAGQLLDRMIAAMGYARDDVYVCNVVKCRPPENRTPRPEEAVACARFLVPQLELVAPKVIVALGRCAAENLGLVPPEGGRWRGRWGTWHGVPVMPTYHPAYLLRTPEQKRVVWEDLQEVMRRLGRTPPARARRG